MAKRKIRIISKDTKIDGDLCIDNLAIKNNINLIVSGIIKTNYENLGLKPNLKTSYPNLFGPFLPLISINIQFSG